MNFPSIIRTPDFVSGATEKTEFRFEENTKLDCPVSYDYIIENKDAYIYVSILENQTIRDFELKLKSTIIDNALGEEILYLDLTDIYNDSEKLKEAVKKYSVNNKKISNVPCILVFKEGILTNIYDIQKNNYEIDELEDFLEDEGINIDD